MSVEELREGIKFLRTLGKFLAKGVVAGKVAEDEKFWKDYEKVLIERNEVLRQALSILNKKQNPKKKK